MFLAHFSSTPLNVLLEFDGEDLLMWHASAIEVHKQMNTPSK